jgi:hypothetical protein
MRKSMKSRIWRLAGVGLLCVSVSAQTLAEGQGPQDQQGEHSGGGGQHGYSGEHSGRGEHGGSSPLQSKPDEVRQTQQPRQGYYQDIPRNNHGNPHSQAGGPGQRHDDRWEGRPDGHGNGWGPGPQYRPGHEIERFPDQHMRVPYHGNDYFYSGGYWYRPHGSRYVVVEPPHGIRVNYLPAYSREVWIGGALFFLAAGTYYQYLNDTREYVVVNPPIAVAPQPMPVPVSNGYDVIAYPAYGQSPQQVDQDRYDCHRWAVEQSGFDPAAATYAPPAYMADNYRRAMGACLSGRGYSVN